MESLDPQSRDAFSQGFASVFRQWTALQLAVHNLWGGPQSPQKADELMRLVFEVFLDPRRIYKDVSYFSTYKSRLILFHI